LVSLEVVRLAERVEVGPALLARDDARFQSDRHGFQTIGRTKLAPNGIEMMLDGARADGELERNILPRQATGGHRQTLAFARAQLGPLQIRRYEAVEDPAHEELMKVE